MPLIYQDGHGYEQTLVYGDSDPDAVEPDPYMDSIYTEPEPPTFRSEGTDPRERAPLRLPRGRPIGQLILGRNWGVEVEYNSRSFSQNDLAFALVEAGLQARYEDYNHSTRTHWKCTSDSTVSGGECVSPILRGVDAVEDVRTVTKVIQALGGYVAGNCGTHVHHDLNDLTATQLRILVANLGHAHDALLGYIPRARLERAAYAHAMYESDFTQLLRAVDNGTLYAAAGRHSGGCPTPRYSAFNFESLLSYGTVEFRAHPGTLNAAKLQPWVAAGQAIVEFSRREHEFGLRQSAQSLMEHFLAERLIHPDQARKFIDRVASCYGDDRVTDPYEWLRAA